MGVKTFEKTAWILIQLEGEPEYASLSEWVREGRAQNALKSDRRAFNTNTANEDLPSKLVTTASATRPFAGLQEIEG